MEVWESQSLVTEEKEEKNDESSYAYHCSKYHLIEVNERLHLHLYTKWKEALQRGRFRAASNQSVSC